MKKGTLSKYCKDRGLVYITIYTKVRYLATSIEKINEKTHIYDFDELDAILETIESKK